MVQYLSVIIFVGVIASIAPLISCAATISTFVGNGVVGFAGDGGPATAAQLSGPHGLAVDSEYLYISDWDNERVRVVHLVTGIISTLAGNGTAGYSGDGGPAALAMLYYPAALAVSPIDGSLFIADCANHRIRVITVSTRIISTYVGSGAGGSEGSYCGDGGPASAACLSYPSGVAVASNGDVFVGDAGNQRVRVVRGGTIVTFAGDGNEGYGGDHGPATSAMLNYPNGLAVSDAGVFISDRENNVVRFVAPNGTIITVAGNGRTGGGGDGGPATSAELNFAAEIGLTLGGDLLIADYNNRRVRLVASSTGVITTIAGNGTAGFAGDGGAATAAELADVTGVAAAADGRIFSADYQNARIRVITPISHTKGYSEFL